MDFHDLSSGSEGERYSEEDLSYFSSDYEISCSDELESEEEHSDSSHEYCTKGDEEFRSFA